jgi:hypothetical protein
MILVMVLTLFVQFQEVQAFAPVIALGGAALICAAALLVAAGCSFATTASAEYTSNSWYENLLFQKNNGNADAINAFNSFVSFYNTTSQIKFIDDILWSNVRNYVNSFYNPGTNTQTFTGSLYYFTIGGQKYYFQTDKMYTHCYGYVSDTVLSDYTYRYVDVDATKGYVYYDHLDTGMTNPVNAGGLYCAKIDVNTLSDTIGYVYKLNDQYIQINLRYLNVSGAVTDYAVSQFAITNCTAVSSQDLTVEGDTTAVDSQTWDLPKTAEGERAISIPADITGDIAITWDDVIPAEETTVTPVPTTAPTDTSGDINWEPLKLVGTVFTDRFPFSLPWDLLRSFTTLSGNTGDPDISIAVPNTFLLKGFAFNVDLSIFDNLVQVSKAFELLAFDIGLILITRKLLGGAV